MPKVSVMFNIHIERFGFQFLTYDLLINHVLAKWENAGTIKLLEGILYKSNQPSLKLQSPYS